MTRKVSVDDALCVGCGLCSAICHSVFHYGPTGKSGIVPGSDPELPCVDEAAEGCPVSAIEITEE